MYVIEKGEITVTGVSYRYISGGKSHPRAKKYPYAYGVDSQGRFASWRIPVYMIPFYKLKKRKVKRLVCTNCYFKFAGVIVRDGPISCPVCGKE